MDIEASKRSAWRFRVYPVAILATLLTVVVFAAVTYDEADPNSRLGGDYPAFFAAGSIVSDGDWKDLYSPERQQREQAGLIDDEGGYLYFAYPPFVAAGYGLLASFTYAASYLTHTLLMAAALAGAVWFLWPWLRRIGWPATAVYAAALAFYPFLRAIPGGQNTSLSLLLFAAATRFDADGHPFASGAALALLLFKPQFGVVMVPLLIAARRWRMLAGWGSGAFAVYLVAAMPLGWNWIAGWWDQAASFQVGDAANNGANFVSFPGFLENLASGGPSLILGYFAAGLLGVAVVAFWWRNPRSRFLERYALAAATVVLVAPHALYYDAGLVVLGLGWLVISDKSRHGRTVTLLIAVSWLQAATSHLGWSPLGPIAWIGAGWLVWQTLRGQGLEATPV